MSSTKIQPLAEDFSSSAADLFLPLVNGVIEAGENLVDEFCSIAQGQGLTSKGVAIAIWKLHRHSAPMKVSDLAQSLDCDAGNTSGLLDRLEHAGLVERTQGDDDRRVRLVQLTPKGRKIGSQMETDYKRSWIYRSLKELSPRERDVFEDVLDRLNRAANRSQSRA